MRTSIGNKGVDQLDLTFFSKCGIMFLLFPLVMVLFCTMGCIEVAPPLSQAPSQAAEHQQAEDWPSSLQLDFDADVSSSLFYVQGNIMLQGNGSLPYLLLNATLSQGGITMLSTKYLLMDVDPGEDHGFEISKNIRILPGSYNCTLEVAGPKGSLACETRRCKSPMPWIEPLPAMKSAVDLPPEAAPKIAEQKTQEETLQDAEDRGEKIQKDGALEEVVSVSSRPGKGARPESVPKESQALSNASLGEATFGKEDSQMENASQKNDSSSQVGASLKASSTLLPGQKGMFVGSSTSKKYHRLDCRYAAKIKAENKIYFSGEEDARVQGYLPCKTCNP
jgi:hypothetical protein